MSEFDFEKLFDNVENDGFDELFDNLDVIFGIRFSAKDMIGSYINDAEPKYSETYNPVIIENNEKSKKVNDDMFVCKHNEKIKNIM